MSEARASRLILEAARFACERHAGQMKPRQKRPVIDHCLEVALLVCDVGLPEETVVAAILHDTLEKTETTSDELLTRFGPRVQVLVEAVTEPAGETDDAAGQRLKTAPADAQSIKCADIISNLQALAEQGALTAKDISDKAASLKLLAHADRSLAEQAARIIQRGAGE